MLSDQDFKKDLIIYCEQLAQELFDQGTVRDSNLEISAAKAIIELTKLLK